MKVIDNKFDYDICEEGCMIYVCTRTADNTPMNEIKLLDYILSKGHTFLFERRGAMYFRKKGVDD